jgi:hypothetical protein
MEARLALVPIHTTYFQHYLGKVMEGKVWLD